MLTSVRGLVAATVLAGCALTATPAFADESDPPPPFTVSASAAVVSQYRFRGLSQSDNKPAIQGAFTLKHESGFYLSTWGSSTAADFGKTPIAPGGTEIDVYGGYTHAFSGITIDVGGYGYIYPNVAENNYFEIYGSVAGAIGPVTAKAGVYYAPGQEYFKFYNVTNHNAYIYGELSGGIPGTPIALHGHLGYTDGGLRYLKNYLDYNVGISYTWNHLTLDASLVGTDISNDDANAVGGCVGNSDCIRYFHRPAKTVGVVSLTASF